MSPDSSAAPAESVDKTDAMMKKECDNLKLAMRRSLALDSLTLKSYEAYLCLQKNRSEHTVRAYMQLLSAFENFSKAYDGDDVGMIRGFIKDSAGSCSKATQALRASALRNFINWSPALDGPQKSLLLKHIQSPKISKRVPRIIELSDLQRILEYIQTQKESEQVLFFLLYGSGLRISEALSAEWRNVNLSEGSLKILGKGAKERLVPLVPELIDLLSAMNLLPGDKLVMAAPAQRLAHSWVQRWGKELGLEEKNGRWHPHKLRHSIATHLLQMGGKVPQIQKLLGHEQLSTTEKYTHLNNSDLLSIYKKSMPLP
jgi:integrase/recombinase XerC